MIEHIITKMVLDRTCPVCNGIQRYRATESANNELIVCNNCEGRGFMDKTEPSVLIVHDKTLVAVGVRGSMQTQKMYVVDSIDDTDIKGLKPMRIYTYNISVDNPVFRYLYSRNPREIHMY
jgi:hypothetical protein